MAIDPISNEADYFPLLWLIELKAYSIPLICISRFPSKLIYGEIDFKYDFSTKNPLNNNKAKWIGIIHIYICKAFTRFHMYHMLQIYDAQVQVQDGYGGDRVYTKNVGSNMPWCVAHFDVSGIISLDEVARKAHERVISCALSTKESTLLIFGDAGLNAAASLNKVVASLQFVSVHY